MTSFCWDLLPPSDPKDLPTFLEAETHAVFERIDREGETEFLCCTYDRTTGRWDSRLETYNENKAEIWFNSISSEV